MTDLTRHVVDFWRNGNTLTKVVAVAIVAVFVAVLIGIAA